MLRNLVQQTKKEPLALLGLFVALAFGLLNNDWFWKLFEGQLEVTIAIAKDALGRCVDKEIVIENATDRTVTNVRAVVATDYLTRRGDVTLEYARLSELMVAPAERTMLPRRAEMPVSYKFDPNTLLLSIPRLAPAERIHLSFGESGPSLEQQREAIKKGEAGFMDVPAFYAVSHDGGRAKVTYSHVRECASRAAPR